MKLEKLSIQMNHWGDNEGRYTGEIEYKSEKGAVKMVLDDRISALVLKAIGANIAELTRSTAERLAESIAVSIKAAQTPMIEAPKDEISV